METFFDTQSEHLRWPPSRVPIVTSFYAARLARLLAFFHSAKHHLKHIRLRRHLVQKASRSVEDVAVTPAGAPALALHCHD